MFEMPCGSIVSGIAITPNSETTLKVSAAGGMSPLMSAYATMVDAIAMPGTASATGTISDFSTANLRSTADSSSRMVLMKRPKGASHALNFTTRMP
jgi:hypothetical protein